ncbi:transcription factor A, mitochondrial [Hyalella azteca]|uniref:Transcription factor A, mitochondrial n=1 Tax=Hyalella azteca TaxID=294128 RepID=A0A8B7NH77_HYAAZ|nr:transcription factor A, mitochondrial [Hyalella azteca]
MVNISTGPVYSSSHKSTTVFEELGLPEPPKRPISPFINFSAAVRKDLLTGKSLGERSLELSKKWESLPLGEKNKYLKRYDEEKAKYLADKESYQKSIGKEQLAQIKLLKQRRKLEQQIELEIKKKKLTQKEDSFVFGKPKVPLNSFFLYLNEVSQQGETLNQEFISKKSREWKALGVEGQEQYRLRASKLRDDYNRDLQKWETKMIKEGRNDLVRKSTLASVLKNDPKKELNYKAAKK